MNGRNNGHFSPVQMSIAPFLCPMKKIKISLFTGELESSGQSSVYQLFMVLIMAAFLLALAYVIKEGILVALIKLMRGLIPSR
jgi:hypothetical protein